MDRLANRPLIENFIDNNKPDGVAHLAVASKVGCSTIRKIRETGRAPRKTSSCLLISKALGVDINEAFPMVENPGQAP